MVLVIALNNKHKENIGSFKE